MENDDINNENKGLKGLHPGWLFAIGVLAICVGIYITTGNPPISTEKEFIGGLFKEIGVAIIISVSLVFSLETNHYREYFSGIFKEQAKELLINDKYIESLTRGKQEQLKQELDRRLFFKERASDRDELWDFLNNELSKLIVGYYYSEFNVSINCQIETLDNDNKTKVIKKNVIRSMSIVNPTIHEQEIELPLDYSFEKIEDIEDKDLLKILKITYKIIDEKNIVIEEKNITDEINRDLKPKDECNTNCKSYCVNFACAYTIVLPSNSNLAIDYEIETIVPITDVQYIHRISKPCKRYRTNFIINNDEYQIDGWGFAFDDKRRMKMVRQPSNVSISFTDWILPGDGTIFLLHKKS